MTRLFFCIALALALTSSAFVMAQDTSATTTAPAPAPAPAAAANGCVIATPQNHLKVGKSESIEFQNCQGSGNVKVRYGDIQNLAADHTLACSNVQFTGTRVTCSFTPARAGTFSLSTIDGSNMETFSGPFNVDAASAPAVAQTIKEDTTGPHTKGTGAPGAGTVPMMKKPAAFPAATTTTSGLKTESLGTVHKAAPMAAKPKGAAGTAFARRALYDMTDFLVW
ncbi:hypothetical protein BGX24_012169 [Mortierella sp. AD032]|nr:hypothetical protein BGX24_012169 [Mortierella sp. AD032]